MQDYKVLVVDLDQQRNLSKYSNVDLQQPTVYNVLNAQTLIDDAIQHTSYYDILISDERLGNAGKEFGEIDDVWLLKDALQNINYDYVILDNAPSRSPLLTMSYIASDYCIVVTDCDEGSLDGISKVYDDIQRLKQRSNDYTKANILGILLTKYENTILHATSYNQIKEIADSMNVKPFKTVIRKSIVASECKLARKSVNEYAPNNNVSIDYRNFLSEVLERIGA
jgi:chromosome partitioning protein